MFLSAAFDAMSHEKVFKELGWTPRSLSDPRLDPAYFDILIVPHHDPARGENVIVTTGALNRLDQSHIACAARHLPKLWQTAAKPRGADLVGGDNRRHRISERVKKVSQAAPW